MKKLLILFTIYTFTSCGSISQNSTLKKIGVFDTRSELGIIKNKNQKILFLKMHHVGKKEFYNDVAHKIDSLQKLGYTVFYESAIDEETDSLITIKNGMKLRKLMGFFPDKYLDTTTNIIAGKIKFKGNHKLFNQPKYTQLNVSTYTSIKADVNLSELITEFEKKYSEIKLEDCDFRFRLEDKNYKCKMANKSLRKKFEKEFIQDYRNRHLAKKIIDSKKKKVLVVYGDTHYVGLYREFLLNSEL
ncbi:hypothetical protein [Croceivirga radicis]|uniref:TraB/GumN family protein n=1 Tax=Croceivirga radicis TaxID=1929488 RepID=A0A1V6LPH1_9FLAO|nr:hypothetical protein [Croceivirga radicis]OQD42081.1 hypothetical protein BUL40_11680 [Croceivirga radicis]